MPGSKRSGFGTGPSGQSTRLRHSAQECCTTRGARIMADGMGLGKMLKSWGIDAEATPDDGDLAAWAAAELEKSRKYRAGVAGLLATGEPPVTGSSTLRA